MESIELYDTQRKFIRDCKQVIDNSEVGIFSSPTGTGKTLSLLLSISDYIKSDNCESMLDNIFDQVSSKTHIYFTSRTHSQLNQCITELNKLNLNTNSIIMGSRKMYCINKEINKKDGIDKVNQKCKDLQNNEKCEFYKNEIFKSGILNIEEVVKEGRRHNGCPYYFMKKYYKTCELVFLPYNLIFNEDTRNNYKINLKDSILIVDEAHNILEAVEDINTKIIYFEDLKYFLKIFQRYCRHLKNKSKTRDTIEEFLNVFTELLNFENKMSINDEETILKVNDFLHQTFLVNCNMLELEENAKNQNILLKIESYSKDTSNKIFEILKFLNLLVNSDKDTRIKVSKKFIKIFPLNPKIYFEPFSVCKSIIFAGGTMEPIDRLRNIFDTKKVSYFSYESVCSKYKGFIIEAVNGHLFELKEKTKNLDLIKQDLKLILTSILKNIEKGGVVIFLPAKMYLDYIKRLLNLDKQFNELESKNLFFEYEHTFEDYKESVSYTNSVLFAVIGGKLSEGINFSDDLCRVLVILGVPFSNMTLEMQQKINFFGQSFYLQNAMKKVNQTIGRAIRHKNDYATMFLIDSRYVKYKSSISPWIQKKLVTCDIFTSLNDAVKFLSEQEKE